MEVRFQELTPQAVLPALQGPGTNALVHNPFKFEELAAEPVLPALQGPGTNALVHNPFSWSA
ncbi:streptamidine-related RiPP repeat protein [Acrocarpospora catenulata]|uniref:streptamidine-related RiPP repeat protein n=1 Tax=Acrocarpospora catenulata TaxID=2836182 RepID=UPI001BDB0F80|nr:streptamidine-related RiPP repeat protein [Acrocarpospora catenulata]